MKFKTVCERVRPNNGMVEVLLTRRPDMSDHQSHEEHVLLNLHDPQDNYRVGDHYWVEIIRGLPN